MFVTERKDTALRVRTQPQGPHRKHVAYQTKELKRYEKKEGQRLLIKDGYSPRMDDG